MSARRSARRPVTSVTTLVCGSALSVLAAAGAAFSASTAIGASTFFSDLLRQKTIRTISPLGLSTPRTAFRVTKRPPPLPACQQLSHGHNGGTMTDASSSSTNPYTAVQPAENARDYERARAILRGTQRLLRSLDFESVSEVTLANGRRADILAIRRNGEIWIVEIKSSIADFRADQKWSEYRDYCDALL